MDGIAEVVVPVVAIFMIFGLPMVAFIVFRVLKHRERMAMIERGVDPGWRRPADGGGGAQASRGRLSDDPAATLRRGITLTAVGLALTVGLGIAGIKTEQIGGIPGLGLATSTVWKPGPSLLLGLVPLFVGLAQVLTAVLSGATFGPMKGPVNPPEPGVAPPPFPSAPVTGATYDGPYTYRPDGTTELRPPTAPPERR